MSKFRSAIKWLTPNGILGMLAPKPSHQQSQRQHELYRRFVAAGSLAFDIGANLGNRIDALLNCGARVVAVEPQPDCAASLGEIYGNRVTVVQAAAGAAQGRRQLHISAPFDVVASLSDEFISRAQETLRFGDRKWTKTIEVEVVTLDTLVARFGTPSFIKIDVEGYEYEVLRGLSKPVDVVSIEWTSDSPKNTLQCLEYFSGIGLNYFQFSFGESMLLAHSSSLDFARAKDLIVLLGEERSLFGDIYASRLPILRGDSPSSLD